jgi:hypothetical protein
MSEATISSARDRRWLILGVIGLAQLMVILGHQAPMGLALAHGYDIGFWWIASIFAVGTVVSGALLRRGPLGQKRTPPPAHGGVTMAQAETTQERVP